MNRFEHLQKNVYTGSDWHNNLLKKSMPIRAFTNTLTANLLLSCEAILVASMKPSDRFKKWFSL